MKKIIIAIDYNPSSQVVAETGFAVAVNMKAELVLVHVISDAAYYAIPYSPIMGFEGFVAGNTLLLADELKKEAEKFLVATAKHLGNETIATKVLEGDTAEAILDYSSANGADLLVIGSHSHSGLYKLFVGGVTEKILQHSKIPLLVIPNKETRVEGKG